MYDEFNKYVRASEHFNKCHIDCKIENYIDYAFIVTLFHFSNGKELEGRVLNCPLTRYKYENIIKWYLEVYRDNKN